MAVIDIAGPLRDWDRNVQFDSFAPAVSVADFWAEAGAAETRRLRLREVWSGRVGILLSAALTLLATDLAALLRLTH